MRTLAAIILIGLGSGAAAQSKTDRVSAVYGYDDAAAFETAMLAIAKNLSPWDCPAGVTADACAAIETHFLALAPRFADRIRADAATHAIQKFGETPEGAIAAFNAQSVEDQERGLCVGPVTLQCEILFEVMASGASMAPVLTLARAQAAADVPRFYTDGRPFDG